MENYCDVHYCIWSDVECPFCASYLAGVSRASPPAVLSVHSESRSRTDTPSVRLGYTPDKSKIKIFIRQCPDSSMWYANKIGQHVTYCGTWPEGYKSYEDAGYLNIVKFEDAQIVHLP